MAVLNRYNKQIDSLVPLVITYYYDIQISGVVQWYKNLDSITLIVQFFPILQMYLLLPYSGVNFDKKKSFPLNTESQATLTISSQFPT